MKAFVAAVLGLLLSVTLPGAQEARTDSRPEPVFPAAPEGLVWLEAENAISTNFSNQAVLDYGSSGFRQLQLNRDGQSGAAPFYAEYAFFVDTPGTWDLWLGGTPPGPESDLLASFISPLAIKVNEGEPLQVHREAVDVNERYSVNNYWYKITEPVQLKAGVNTIRMEISETRRYDSRYYFFLDAFFLTRQDSPMAQGLVTRSLLPDRFPKDLDDRSINTPFQSIPQYEYKIQTEPRNKEAYLLLAQVYSLIGDHGNAVKTISRGRVMAGDDPAFTLLAAKSRIWSGEIDEGLRLYREYLANPDADPAIWAEAAKMSAWLMKYREAETLYTQALALYPDDINLRTNYALTLLWEGRVNEGERILEQLWQDVMDDPDKVLRLGRIYEVSGYPDKGIETYSKGLAGFPDLLELYLRLIQAYEKSNQEEKAAETFKLIQDRFTTSDRLTGLLEALAQESSMKKATLDGYRQRLSVDPDNLELRLELLRAYYWNGMLEDALDQGNQILANKLFTILLGLDDDLGNAYRLMDLLHALRTPLNTMRSEVQRTGTQLQRNLTNWQKAAALEEKNRGAKDPNKHTKALDDLAVAEEALSLELARAEGQLYRSVQLMNHLARLIEEAMPEYGMQVADQDLLGKTGDWRFDVEAELSFLRGISDGNPLAYHGLLRISSFYPRQQPSTPGMELLDQSGKILSQTRLWLSGKLDQDWNPLGYYDHGAELQSAILDQDIDATPPISPLTLPYDPVQAVTDMQSGINDFLEKGSTLASETGKTLALLMDRARTRLAVRMYQFDSEVAQDRREMADIFLGMDKPAEAVQILAKVLVINPSDASSKFTLGRALEMSGDWVGAMAAYMSVYTLNPRFETAISSYNRLAEAHAKVIEVELESSVDSNRTDMKASLTYTLPVTSQVDLHTSYQVENWKIHNPQAGSLPDSVQLHSLELQLPYKLGSSGFTLSPRAKMSLQNKLANYEPPLLDDFSVEPLTDYIVTSPGLGVSIGWTKKSIDLGITYSFNQLADTFFADRYVHFEHSILANSSFYKENPMRSLARIFGFRTVMDTGFRFSPYEAGQENIAIHVEGEMRVGSLLFQSPYVLLDLGLLGSWQDTQGELVPDYYSPSEVFTVKGGATLTARFDLARTATLSVSTRWWPGYLAILEQGRFSQDGSIRVDYSSRGLTLYTSIAGSRSEATATDPVFWSASVGVGARLRLGNYIIP
jgi:tetratricopeptide (TPR) repeat protein